MSCTVFYQHCLVNILRQERCVSVYLCVINTHCAKSEIRREEEEWRWKARTAARVRHLHVIHLPLSLVFLSAGPRAVISHTEKAHASLNQMLRVQVLHLCWKVSQPKHLHLFFRGPYQSQMIGKREHTAREDPQQTWTAGTTGKGYIEGTTDTKLIFRSKNNLEKHGCLVLAHHANITS